MKNFSSLILLVLAIATSSVAAEVQTVKSISVIPPEVLQALTNLCKPCSFADFGAEWNPTDVDIDALNNLPRRCLISVSHSETEWTIQYEHGGRGRHFHTATFALQPAIHFVRGSSCAPSEDCHEW